MKPLIAEDVAVIVVNYNAGAHLIACLDALLSLIEPPGEIIVVDNASEDDSIDRARAKFSDVTYIDSGANTGFAAANNLGIQTTSKPWIALVNPDAFVAKNWLQCLIEASRRNPMIRFFSAE